MNDTQRKAMLDGRLDMPLFDCVLTQRTSQSPIIHRGPALLTQTPEKSLLLRFFSNPLSASVVTDSFNKDFSQKVGVVVPEHDYYDFVGLDSTGEIWKTERLSLSRSTGSAGTYITAPIRKIESSVTYGKVHPYPSVRAFVVGAAPKMPWHERTITGSVSTLDRFEGECENALWKLRKTEKGLEIFFQSKTGNIKNAFWRFLVGLRILTGKYLDPTWMDFRQNGDLITEMTSELGESGDMVFLPLPMSPNMAAAAHFFLGCFMENIDSQNPPDDRTQLVADLWGRILRAGNGGLETSALALTVAIEAFLGEAFTSEHDRDDEFVEQAAKALPILAGTEISERVRSRLQASLGSAATPRTKDLLHRLVDQGFLTKCHVVAWEKLRNAMAHGAGLGDDADKFQNGFNRHVACMGLFYCLVFALIGYRGSYVDYSLEQWPEALFSAES